MRRAGAAAARGADRWLESEPVWIGNNPHKGLAVFAFNGYAVRLCEQYHPSLRYVAPVHVTGPRRSICWRCGRRTPAAA